MWLARTGEGGYALTDCVKREIVALRYHTVGDARTLTVDEIAAAVGEAKTRTALVAVAGMLYEFVHSVQPGDIVVTPHAASRTVYFGEVTGPYEWADPAPVSDLFHFRTITWWGSLDRDTDFSVGRLKDIDRPTTFYELTDRVWWVERAESARVATNRVVPPPRSARPAMGSSGGASTTKRPDVASAVCDVCGLRKPTAIINDGICGDCT
jgi:predicted Mrr-cat superfamily restriction endonuclease